MCLSDAGCNSGLVCTSNTNTSHTCVECLTNSDCPTGVCNTNTNLCATCAQNSDCSSGEVCDTTNGNCVACLSTADCSSGVCDTSSNTCVECLANSDCSAGQLCNTASNTCVLCLSDSDCSAGLQCIASEGTCGTVCASHNDCAVNTICSFSTSPSSCVAKQCNHNNECVGSYCESGYCVLDPIPSGDGTCTTNADCTVSG